MTWICSCGELWPASGRKFRVHLGKCEIAKDYKKDKEFNVDTNNETSTKTNAINLSTYQELFATPGFGKIITGSTTGRLTMRFHHEYIFGYASCEKRFGGDHAYNSLVTHQKRGKYPLPDGTFLTPD